MGSGMYWRKDPRSGGGSFSGPPEWPRNGAELKGVVHEVQSKPEDCAQWLEVSSYKQAGTDSWVETPGCWMQVRPHLYFFAPPPFRAASHPLDSPTRHLCVLQFDQHGPLLHKK